jgi:hypothetical protein
MTGGAGNTFALVTGNISKPGGTASVQVTIDPAHFTLPHGSFTLGVDVVPLSGSTLQPLISSIQNQHSQVVAQAFHSVYNPRLSHAAVAAGKATSAVLTPVSFSPKHPGQAVHYTVNIKAESNTTGGFLLGFYLPGDVTGNGAVDKSDIQAIVSNLGTNSSQSNYNFEADANRDGRIGLIDLTTAERNLGVKTDIQSAITADLDPASDAGAADRITNIQNVHFTGTGTPGATIVYSEINHKTANVSTTVGSDGKYSLTIPLAPGANTFSVTSTDAFGQVISGQISPVTYTTGTVPPAASLNQTIVTKT